MSKWSQFYVTRINSSYQDYFEERYEPILKLLVNSKTVIEEGVGIGSISKYLRKQNIRTVGVDKCPDMVKLCKRNNPGMDVFCADIFSTVIPGSVVVTHGVLEHFQDDKITKLLEKYERMGQKSIHYVPTNGYDKPSFGDERLLSPQYWLDTFKPSNHILFNENKDLILIFNNHE